MKLFVLFLFMIFIGCDGNVSVKTRSDNSGTNSNSGVSAINNQMFIYPHRMELSDDGLYANIVDPADRAIYRME